MRPVGFDNTILSILLNPKSRIPLDPETGRPVTEAKRRAEFLVSRLAKARRKIVIPTPVAAELLTAIGPDARQYFSIVARSRLFDIAAFDFRCAVELACLNREIFAASDPKTPEQAYQKVKFDRQIIAIFRVAGVDDIYTDDEGLMKRARLCGLNPIATYQLELPSDDQQMRLDLEAPGEVPEEVPEGDGRS